MINKYKTILFFLVALNIPCFAGGLKGNLVDDKTITFIILGIILIHIASVAAYYGRIVWLKVVCGILYMPIFAIPLVLSIFNIGFALLFFPTIAFFAFIIATKRK